MKRSPVVPTPLALLLLHCIAATLAAQQSADAAHRWSLAEDLREARDERPTFAQAVVELGDGGTGCRLRGGLVWTTQTVVRDRLIWLATSTAQRDLLADGFAACTAAEELRLPGLVARSLRSTADVSAQILADLDATDPLAREATIANRRRALLDELLAGTPAEHRVATEHRIVPCGSGFRLQTWRVHDDVRLVATPSLELATFGLPDDGFGHPRLAVDFALLRLHDDESTAKDGLTIRAAGPQEGEVVHALGFRRTPDAPTTAAELRFWDSFQGPRRLAAAREIEAQVDARRAALATRRPAPSPADRLALQAVWLARSMERRELELRAAALDAEHATTELRHRNAALRSTTAGAAALDRYEDLLDTRRHFAETGVDEAALHRLQRDITDARRALQAARALGPEASLARIASGEPAASRGAVAGRPWNGTIEPWCRTLASLLARDLQFHGAPPHRAAWPGSEPPTPESALATRLTFLVDTGFDAGLCGGPVVAAGGACVGLVIAADASATVHGWLDLAPGIGRTACLHPDAVTAWLSASGTAEHALASWLAAIGS